MGVKEDLQIGLSKWTAKLDNPEIKAKFAGFDKTLQFNFPDQTFNLLMVFKNQACELKEGNVPNPDIIITAKSEVILGICAGKVKPLPAFMTGKIKAKGGMQDMLKVQLLMKN